MKKLYTLSIVALLFSFIQNSVAQQYWNSAGFSGFNAQLVNGPRMPKDFRIFSLDLNTFSQTVRNAPHERRVNVTQSGTIVSFPNASGQLERFTVVQAPVMHEQLAARYPGIYSFYGKGIDNPGASVRFDLSPIGTNAMIRYANQATVYIDHIENQFYRVSSRDAMNVHTSFNCLTESFPSLEAGNTQRPTNANQPTLRTYRLALLSGAEFSNHFLDGTETTDAQRKGKVLIAQNAQMTRANGVFESDFSLRLVLIPNNDTIIYLTASSDPIANPNNPSGSANQTAMNTRVGNANYDIGHTQSKGADNGNAGCIGCVCTNGQKGLGWTVYSNPSLLDFFVIDYLTHEMGHQMGGNHTFSFQTEGTGVNMEPGSGITIMGYAGITGSTDVADHSIDHFHCKSIEQITTYMYNGNGNSCAVAVPTGNLIPTASAGADYIIPRSTPFALTGAGSDGDAADVLTYVWEQIDNRTSGTAFPSATATTGPMFRIYSPTTNPTTLYPSLQYILTGANGFQWEVLPSVQRNLNFRFTVRDNHNIGGGTASDNMVVTVNGTSGPTLVTAPNTTGISWQAGTTQTVTWSVNGSDQAPVNCANVKISLSTDGGFTWPVVLVASTPNDGTETITVPNNPTTTARIKVEAVGNIFFDINNANFAITPPPTGFSFGTSAGSNVACGSAATASASLPTISNGGFSTPINLTASGNPTGTTVSFSPNPVTPGNTATVTLNNSNTLAPGTYNITINGVAGSNTQSTTISYVIAPGTGPAITAQPSDLTVCAGAAANFAATATGSGLSYQWQISTDGGATYTNISGATSATYAIASTTNAQNNTRYKVIITALCGSSTSNAANLVVNSSPAITAQPNNATVCTGSNNTLAVTATGGGLTYQWQVSTNGGTSYSNIAGATASTYTLTGITTALNNNQYQVVINGSCPGTVTSNASILSVGTAPNITSQPSDVTNCAGATTTLTASASGSGIGYQWQISTDGGTTWTNITGATNASYSFTSAVSQTGNKYRVIVSSTTCAVPSTSTVATLTVNSLPAITTQPTSNTLCAGGNVVFTAAATGTGIGYQWQLSTNGGVSWTNIAGATNATYSVNSVTASQNQYQYQLVVSGTCSPAATSNPATLNVVSPVTVTTQPANSTVCAGSNVTLTAAGSGTSIQYQWQVSTNGGTSFSAIAGANSASYTITGATAAISGNVYQVLMSNPTCTTPVATTGAVITVNALPTVTSSATETNVCTGTPVTLLASGANTYSWAPVGLTGQAVIVTPTVLPSNPSVANTVTYTVTGTNANGCSNTSTVSVTANPLPVVTLTVTPANIPLLPGRTVTLRASVTPSTGFNFVWRKDDVVIPNYSADTLRVTVQDVGRYTVEAADANGFCNRTSDAVTIRDSVTSIVFIFPNPNNGNFTVSYYNNIRSTNQFRKQSVTIYDERGAKVYNQSYNVNQGYNLLSVNAPQLASGGYVVVLRDGYGNLIGTGRVFIRH
jgi:hypothetical protein